MIELVDEIDLNKAYAAIANDGAGGNCLFIGTVRKQTEQKAVFLLEFEAYEAMALKEMKKLIEEADRKWDLQGAVIQHVVGKMEVGKPVVVVGASAAHREEAFKACRFLIDELKKTVPIWKKEVFEDETVWVSAHP